MIGMFFFAHLHFHVFLSHFLIVIFTLLVGLSGFSAIVTFPLVDSLLSTFSL